MTSYNKGKDNFLIGGNGIIVLLFRPLLHLWSRSIHIDCFECVEVQIDVLVEEQVDGENQGDVGIGYKRQQHLL